MSPVIICAAVTVPIAAVGLWLYRRDYRKHCKLTAIGLLAIVVAFFMPHLTLGISHPTVDFPVSPVEYVGWFLMLFGLFMCAISMLHFGSGKKVIGMDTTKLETTGLYRITRNPQYVFYNLFHLGYAMTGNSWITFLAVALFRTTVHLTILIEEEHLLDVYGEEYSNYLKSTPRYLFI